VGWKERLDRGEGCRSVMCRGAGVIAGSSTAAQPETEVFET